MNLARLSFYRDSKRTSVKTFFVTLILLFTSSQALADTWLTQTYSEDSTAQQRKLEIDQQVAALGQESIQKLYKYRQAIEKDAYTTTMNLCTGYYLATGRELPHGHKNISKVEATKAWLKLSKEGFLNPLSSIGGLKADYLEQTDASILSIDSWFRSLYVIYLLESTGFLQASVHCLNTLEHDEIVNFALAVLQVDLAATAAMELGLFLTGEEIFNVIAKATRWVFRPFHYFVKLMRERLFKRSYVTVIGIVVLPIAYDNFSMHMKKMDELEKSSKIALESIIQTNNSPSQREKMLIAYNVYKLAQEALKSQNSQALVNFIHNNISDSLAENMTTDLEALRKKSSREQNDEMYYQVLELALPIINSIKKT